MAESTGEGSETCQTIGWWKPSPHLALKLVCSLKPHEGDATHVCRMPDLLSVGQVVSVSWTELSQREPD